MFKKALFLILCSVLSCTLYAQSSSVAVESYFSKIYSAENNLVEGNHEQSLNQYNRAFESDREEKIIFLKDIHNALMLAYQNGDTEYFEKFLHHLNDYDINKTFFETVGYEDIRETNFYPIVRTFFENKPERTDDSPVCSLFERLFVLDQSIRSACREKYLGSLYHYCSEEIKLLDSLILAQLSGYFRAYGIPQESEFCDVSKHFVPPYHLIIRHNLQWCRTEIIDYLKGEIGRIHPQILADILKSMYNNSCDGSETSDPLGLSHQLRLGSDLYLIPLSEEKMDEINQNRKAINLDSFEDFHKKILFQEFNPEYYLVHGFFIPQFDADKGVLDGLRERFEEFRVVGPE
ncbi:MAG: hypothetical protein EA411_09615 [Saprospirales bacterium]|nr:MAG: hypothetical protein EA411_09615 [Saprospirales bacterium]